ncbi:MAG: hypothetical protein H6735_30185 [Alphaproteobacteria bacterium]|nr:hypothetical protein [Alphaproteobacteria bacterium]
MIVALACSALAVPADTGTCGPLNVQGVSPADGAVVPPETVFTVLGEPYYPLCAEPLLELYHDGSPVGGTVASDGVARWWFTPIERLLVGETYEFWAIDPMSIYAPVSLTVTVADQPWPDETPPELTLTVDHRCEAGRVVFDTDLDFTAPTSGVLQLDYRLGSSTAIRYVALDGDTSVSTSVGLPGAGEPCVSATLLDLAGRRVWTTEEVCQPSYVCPSYGEPLAVVYAMEPVCDTSPVSTDLHVEVDLPAAEPDTVGTMLVEVTNDLGSQGVVWGVQLTGKNADTVFDVRVPGIHDVCFDLVMTDPRSGEEAWRSGPYCSEAPLVCEDAPRPASSEAPGGCGCANAPGGAGGAWVGALVLLRGRRGRRRPDQRSGERLSTRDVPARICHRG